MAYQEGEIMVKVVLPSQRSNLILTFFENHQFMVMIKGRLNFSWLYYCFKFSINIIPLIACPQDKFPPPYFSFETLLF